MTDYTLTGKGWILGALLIVLPIIAATAAVKESGPWPYWIIFLVTIVLIGVNYKSLWINKVIQDSRRQTEKISVDLGKVWYFQESIKENMGSKVGDYRAVWKREGGTQNFDGDWKDGHNAKLYIEAKGPDVTIFRRDHTSIVYKGTVSPDGKHVTGDIHSEKWTGTWRAEILDSEYTPTPVPTKTPIPKPTATPRPYKNQSSSLPSTSQSKTYYEPPRPPEKNYQKVEARVYNADDKATMYINEREAVQTEWGKGYQGRKTGHRAGDSGWVDVTRYINPGNNTFRFSVYNAPGCCGVSGSFEVKVDGELKLKKYFNKQSSKSGVLFDETESLWLGSQPAREYNNSQPKVNQADKLETADSDEDRRRRAWEAGRF